MSKKLYIIVTDNPADDSCTINVKVSPDMSLFTLNKIQQILKRKITAIINKGWDELQQTEREKLLAEEVQYG